MKNRKIIALIILFLIINGAFYIITEKNVEQRTDVILKQKLEKLKTHTAILEEVQRENTKTIHYSTLHSGEVANIMLQASKSTPKEQAILRKKLQKLLADIYLQAKEKGVLQYHFVFKNNITFLRMHKINKFGDDLTDIRDDFKYVNNTKKPIKSFIQGRTSHGFRNIFPIFTKNNEYVGAMDISFSTDRIEWFLNNISHVQTHFLVFKDVFKVKAWKRDDLTVKYVQSIEHKNYMMTKYKLKHKYTDLKEIRDELNDKINKGNSFSTYLKHKNHIDVISFLAIKNLKNNTVAWLVSYEKSEFLKATFKNIILFRLMIFIFSFILVLFLCKLFRSKDLIQNKLQEIHELNIHQKEIIEQEIKKSREKDVLLLQQSKLAQMGDMVSMIAHQWRQPLNAISASSINLSLLSSMGILEDSKVQENSEFIQEQTQKMSQTIDTFMNFVKPSKESKEFKPSHTVEAIIHIMGMQLANHNIEVNVESKKENISLVGYEDLLEQVIINLLSNARDAFEELDIENKKIDITIDTKNNIPIITIEDNAGGIPKDIQEKIFNPYFTTKEQGKGTGIGLYMSMDIMKKSFEGDLVYSYVEGGSRFELVFAT